MTATGRRPAARRHIDLGSLPEMATVAQVAAVLQMSRTAVWAAVYGGDIPSVIVGARLRRIPRNLLEERLSEQLQASA